MSISDQSLHTPGPWLAIGTTPREEIVRAENGDVIALVPHNMPRVEYEANARLLAASPKLLAALKAASGYLLNAKIDLETGCPKATAIRTIEGGLKLVREAIDAAERR
jgi:hypothetical protein